METPLTLIAVGIIVIMYFYVRCLWWVEAERQRLGIKTKYPRTHQHYVYFWRNAEDRRYVKIGRTNNPYKRINTFGTAQPRPPKVLAVIAVKNAVEAEKLIHRLFAPLRVSPDREWFYWTPTLCLYFNLLRDKQLTDSVQRRINYVPKG